MRVSHAQKLMPATHLLIQGDAVSWRDVQPYDYCHQQHLAIVERADAYAQDTESDRVGKGRVQVFEDFLDHLIYQCGGVYTTGSMNQIDTHALRTRRARHTRL